MGLKSLLDSIPACTFEWPNTRSVPTSEGCFLAVLGRNTTSLGNWLALRGLLLSAGLGLLDRLLVLLLCRLRGLLLSPGLGLGLLDRLVVLLLLCRLRGLLLSPGLGLLDRLVVLLLVLCSLRGLLLSLGLGLLDRLVVLLLCSLRGLLSPGLGLLDRLALLCRGHGLEVWSANPLVLNAVPLLPFCPLLGRV